MDGDNPGELIGLTVNEIRRPHAHHDRPDHAWSHRIRWSRWRRCHHARPAAATTSTRDTSSITKCGWRINRCLSLDATGGLTTLEWGLKRPHAEEREAMWRHGLKVPVTEVVMFSNARMIGISVITMMIPRKITIIRRYRSNLTPKLSGGLGRQEFTKGKFMLIYGLDSSPPEPSM
ncbi:hypothetical protein GCM10009799_44370 [Nocardiopsis rhodophaea]|uniref:Uncharacterized protein n=1 Tax=Nocardiopsis rhodophaea TaxID=280238 RepID=A0ABP5EYK6_9ACTN